MKTTRTLLLLTAAAVLTTLTSCRTARGLGSDVKHVGSKIERTADRVSPY